MNEIITFGTNYSLNSGIKIFVKSATTICKNVTVLGVNLNSEAINFIQNQGANYLDCKKTFQKYNVNDSISPYTLKVIYFYLYVKFISAADNVYVCDFTDTFFQKNVFELIENSKAYVCSENFLIKNCPTNSTWLNICYNSDIFNLLSKYEIINGTGNLFGKKQAVLEALKEINTDISYIMGRVGSYPTIDQACLNKVVRFDQHRFNVLNNYEIFNLAHYGDASFTIEGKLIHLNNKAPYVIHQYDVIKPLEKHLNEQFA
jgi:hypothetical protein